MLVDLDVACELGPRDALFLRRVFADGLDKYRQRLRKIGFTHLGRVLDAGCGFGQWTLALAESSQSVVGLDISAERVRVARRLASGRPNISFAIGSTEALGFADDTFDAVFSFSALYYTDVEQSVKEIARVLRPGGLVYICSNGLGWYLYNIVYAPNPSSDFSPRLYGLRTIWDTLLYRWFGRRPSKHGSVVTSRRYLSRILERHGLRVIGCGAEGELRMGRDEREAKPFFRARYLGLEGVSEWLGVKTGHERGGLR